MLNNCDTVDAFVGLFLPMLEESMGQYRKIEGNMHWTIRSAMHERTLISLIPIVEEWLDRSGYSGRYPGDIAAGRIIADISVTIHSKSFAKMTRDEQTQILTEMIKGDMK